VDADLEAIERAMLRIRRSVTRRELGRGMAGVLSGESDLSQLFAVDAVDEATEQAERPVTVGTVAERLGVDPSRASRLVARAVQAGYLKRVASQADGRQSLLELTDAGRDVVQQMHAYRQAQFELAMRDWSPHDRAEFARLLARFTGSL
jgi:DNA-binding MarR family transcriptional regulator